MQESLLDQQIQIAGGGDAGHPEIAHDKVDLGVGVVEEVVEQILTVDLGQLFADALLVAGHQLLDAGDERYGALGRVDHRIEHVEQPGLPVTCVTHRLQFAVVAPLVLDKVAAEIEHRQVEQPLSHQIEQVEDAAGAAIAVIEGVNALELVVDDGHLDQGIGITELVVIDIAHQIVHQGCYLVCMLGRGVDHLAGAGILEIGAGQTAQAGAVLFQTLLHRQNVGQPDQLLTAHNGKALLEGGGIILHLFGGRIDRLFKQVGAVEIILGGDDVLDLRAVFCLLQRQGIDQDPLVGDAGRHPLEFGQIAVSLGALLEHGAALELGDIGQRQRGNGHRKSPFLYMAAIVCIEILIFYTYHGPHR
ncbi:hypothetical protein D3C77_446110 [compost metagenome]